MVKCQVDRLEQAAEDLQLRDGNQSDPRLTCGVSVLVAGV
jgi:hypothetical protein